MFSENLRKRRLELGLSQEELAKTVGYCSRSSIAKLESGLVTVKADKLKKLAVALDMTTDELYGDEQGDIALKANETITNKRRTIALIQAGGKSTRNAMNVPNQFITIDEKPVIVYVLEAYEKHPLIDEIDVACIYGWEKVLKSYIEKFNITKIKHIITGGDTILDSVRLGFGKIRKEVSNDDIVILQEATRPMINTALISKLLSSYEKHGDSVIVKPMSDFVQFIVDNGKKVYFNRDDMYSLESPEVYSVFTLKTILENSNKKLNDDGSCCALIFYRQGLKINFCDNGSNNMKIVRQEDSYVFKVLHSLYL